MWKRVFIFLLLFTISVDVVYSQRKWIKNDYEYHGVIGRAFFPFGLNETWAFNTTGWFSINFKYYGEKKNTMNVVYMVKGLGDYVFKKTFHDVDFSYAKNLPDSCVCHNAYYIKDQDKNILFTFIPDPEVHYKTYLITLVDYRLIVAPKRKKK